MTIMTKLRKGLAGARTGVFATALVFSALMITYGTACSQSANGTQPVAAAAVTAPAASALRTAASFQAIRSSLTILGKAVFRSAKYLSIAALHTFSDA